MAVREATVNAVLHGNEYDPAKQSQPRFENMGKDLVFIITDQGKGLDPEHAPRSSRPRKTFCAARGAASSSSARLWMRYAFGNCIPEQN